jgi:D-alanyl-D-alanine dipeptidase
VTNSSSPQDRAAADALQILAEQAEFARELAASAELQADLADFQTAVGDLAYGVPLAPMSENLKNRLFDRLDRVAARPADLAELLAWPIAQLQQVAADLSNWQVFPRPIGAEWAIWQTDPMQAQLAFFLRVPNAGMLPRHWHATGESILVLEGDFIDDDGTVFGVGDLFVAAADTSHQPTTSLGCLVLSVTSTQDKILALV